MTTHFEFIEFAFSPYTFQTFSCKSKYMVKLIYSRKHHIYVTFNNNINVTHYVELK